MKIFILLLTIVCVATCITATTAVHVGNSADGAATVAVKLNSFAKQFSFLQTGTRLGKGGKGGKGGKRKKNKLEERALCRKDIGDGRFPALPMVNACPYDNIELCTDDVTKLEMTDLEQLNKVEKEGHYNCIIPEFNRGTKCPAGIKLPQVNSFPFHLKVTTSKKKKKSKTKAMSARTNNFVCGQKCKYCNAGDPGYTFDENNPNEGTVDLRGWEIFQIPTTTVYSKDSTPIPWISADQWDSTEGVYKPNCDDEDKPDPEEKLQQGSRHKPSVVQHKPKVYRGRWGRGRRGRGNIVYRGRRGRGNIVYRGRGRRGRGRRGRHLLAETETSFGFLLRMFRKKKRKKKGSMITSWDMKTQSYKAIPFTMACKLVKEAKRTDSSLIIDGCHEGRFVVSMQEKKTGKVECFLVIIKLNQPKIENGIFKAEYARPEIYRLREQKCPEEAGYMDCGTNECLAPSNPFERAIGKIKDEDRCSSAVPDSMIEEYFPDLVKKHTKNWSAIRKEFSQRKLWKELVDKNNNEWEKKKEEINTRTVKSNAARRHILSTRGSRKGC